MYLTRAVNLCSIFPEFGNFPNGRRRRAIPRSVPTDNIQTFDTAAKRRAERQSNGYVPVAERNAATILKGVPYRQAVERRAQGIRGKKSEDYVWALDNGLELNFSKPAPRPQQDSAPRKETPRPLSPSNPPNLDAPIEDSDDVQLAQALQEQMAAEKRAKELRAKIQAKVRIC